MSGKTRFAIVGCGRIAQRHAEHINKMGELAATCDIDFEKANSLAKKYKVTPYAKIDDLLKNTNAEVISICTPNGLHAEHAIKALNAGFHVLCEKPMAIVLDDCNRMIDAADKAKKNLF